MTTLVSVGCVPLLLACGAPDAEESAETADELRAQVHETVRTVSEGLQERGIEVATASGSYYSCGLKTPGLEYAAGLRTTAASGPVPEQVEAAREVIEELGLPMVASDSPDFVSTDGAEDDLRVSANEARAEPGTLVVEVVRDCVELDEDVVDERLNQDVEPIG